MRDLRNRPYIDWRKVVEEPREARVNVELLSPVCVPLGRVLFCLVLAECPEVWKTGPVCFHVHPKERVQSPSPLQVQSRPALVGQEAIHALPDHGLKIKWVLAEGFIGLWRDGRCGH